MKPSKPTPDFPLFPHAAGQWAKKIGGKLRYFGAWSDPQTALARYQGMNVTSKKIPSKGKPAKPYPDFPLYAHSCGLWAKKIRGRVHYFGTWADPEVALAKWLKEKDDLLAGREPSNGEGLLHFISARRDMIRYPEFRERGWQIGSGPTESQCKLCTKRLKGYRRTG